MAALELIARGGNVDYQRLSIGDLRKIARQEHPEHTDEAARVFVERIVDMEVERRTQHDDRLQGYGNVSPTALLGELPGGSGKAREPLAAMYDRGIKTHRSHEEAKRFIQAACLPDRQLLALLIQARKLDRRVKGQWGKSYDQIAANTGPYAQQLGWPPGMASGLYRKGQAIKDAAKAARAALIFQSRHW
ncbi:hypothetical protein [Onishia taeanensis]|nr:hypothetical protein [Halomonas taeanensis]